MAGEYPQRPEEWTIAQIASYLNENLGPRLVAYMVGKNTQTVARWARGAQQPPQPDVERRLRGAFQIFQHLVETDSRHVIRAWFIGMNPQLEDRSPAELVAEGELRAAMAAARAFASGG
ncbi:hypothetical protein [Georgenia sp. MJ170]|uniref:hypothetical protein n=1 Tax=Georgenia sunbinii TaxID=3117728 RepID=UPI002F26AB05